MALEIAGIQLNKIHKIVTLEQAALVSHRVPGLEGNVVQNLGRDSVRLQIEGIFYGATAQDDLEALRTVYKEREPVDFLAEIVGQAYFGQVILERFEVFQLATEPEQFSYKLAIAEYVVPPEPEAATLGFPDVDSAILTDAQSFMDSVNGALDAIDILGSIPNFGNPTEPLNNLLNEFGSATTSLSSSLSPLANLLT